ncbi:MAG: sulfite exporter TauE/SafE family protein, partial [Chitinophagales bacterium]
NGILYNTGRIVTYALLGILFATIGSTFISAGFQQAVSICTGAVIILLLLTPKRIKQKLNTTNAVAGYTNKLKVAWGKIIPQQSKMGLFTGGLLNGLLPCGLVYVALAAALNTGSVWDGALLMAMFGLGTLPAMLAVSTAGNFIGMQHRLRIRKILPVFTFVIALLLIVRGLNLGIPYVSPHMSIEGTVMHCCKNPSVH